MSFWGLALKWGETVDLDPADWPAEQLHISQATLWQGAGAPVRVGVKVTVLIDEAMEVSEEEAEEEEESEDEDGEEGKEEEDDSEVTKQEVVLCSLQKGSQESCPLDLLFSEPLSLTLVCPGDAPPGGLGADTAVHLSGYFMPLEAMPGDYGHDHGHGHGHEEGSEEESEEESEDEEEAEELDEQDLRMLLAQRALQRKRHGGRGRAFSFGDEDEDDDDEELDDEDDDDDDMDEDDEEYDEDEDEDELEGMEFPGASMLFSNSNSTSVRIEEVTGKEGKEAAAAAARPGGAAANGTSGVPPTRVVVEEPESPLASSGSTKKLPFANGTPGAALGAGAGAPRTSSEKKKGTKKVHFEDQEEGKAEEGKTGKKGEEGKAEEGRTGKKGEEGKKGKKGEEEQKGAEAAGKGAEAEGKKKGEKEKKGEAAGGSAQKEGKAAKGSPAATASQPAGTPKTTPPPSGEKGAQKTPPASGAPGASPAAAATPGASASKGVKRPAATPEAASSEKKAKAGSAEKKAEVGASTEKKAKVGSAEKKAEAGGSGEKKAKVSKRSFPNGLEVEELALGQPAGKVAKVGKTVFVKYIGKLKKNGKVFDSNQSGRGFKFRHGVQEVIKGWDLGLEGMRVGDKRRLTIPPQLAYGASGAPPAIPPNAWLQFDVELVDVK